jgi:hypothetical protein
MSEKRFIGQMCMDKLLVHFEDRDSGQNIPPIATIKDMEIVDLLNEQQATIEHLTKSRDKWSKSAKLHSEYFNCLEKAIEIAYEEKPYPKIEDIMTIYSKLEKEINDE